MKRLIKKKLKDCKIELYAPISRYMPPIYAVFGTIGTISANYRLVIAFVNIFFDVMICFDMLV